MKAVHGCKTKCDRKDAEAIARLLKGGNFPPACGFPSGLERPELTMEVTSLAVSGNPRA